MPRTALFIRCTVSEADRIRIEAEKDHRSISEYVVDVLARAIDLEDRLYARKTANSQLSRAIAQKPPNEPGPRTGILVRCDEVEAARIRNAARRRDVPINAFVLQRLKRAWAATGVPPDSIVGDDAVHQ
jgi:predicted HicB family RNase H-like nuclease